MEEENAPNQRTSPERDVPERASEPLWGGPGTEGRRVLAKGGSHSLPSLWNPRAQVPALLRRGQWALRPGEVAERHISRQGVRKLTRGLGSSACGRG